jgi:hypothetical protein
MSMAMTREVELACGAVTVRELTVGEIRAWLKQVEQREGNDFDPVGLALFEDVTFEDLQRMSTIAAGDLDALAPSEVRTLIEAAKELNADFFAMRRRLLQLGQAVAGSEAPPPGR